MLEIISHRGICNSEESSLAGIQNCIKFNFGLELDLRKNENNVYISHDKLSNGLLLEDTCSFLKNSTTKIFFHIKELSALDETLELLSKFDVKNFFIFNTENNELFLKKNIPTADYINKKPTKTHSKILWCDETKEEWFDKEIISDLHKQNKILFAHSLELIKDSTFSEIKQEWKRIDSLGFDGLCTNFPLECSKFLGVNH